VIEPSVAFAALKADGSITAWGMVSNDADWGSTGAPVDKGYTKIYSNSVVSRFIQQRQPKLNKS
jgi:hypothetical protein